MASQRPEILVVDDEPGLHPVVQLMLESAGYAVCSAQDGAAGLARIEAGGIDLVLLDIMMPGMSGLELCRRVRARPAEVYLPIIMLTALDTEAQRHDGFATGADDYVIKPFRHADLLDRVQVWVQ